VISVDTKKKELVGSYKNNGREWFPQGEPEQVRVHDFIDKELGKANPYGVYDVGANTGWVSVGTDHDTAAFAVNTIAAWWREVGKVVHPNASRLLISADGGGSNGYRTRAWKTELAALAAQTRLAITVCHLPPGTSKWSRGRTALSGGPPHRSQRAGLPHWALASGSGCQAHVRVGMHHTDLREPSSRVPAHPFPGNPSTLATSP
jgi:hypothetical protein